MNRDEIVRAMDALVPADGSAMADESVAEYERLEGELQRAAKTEEIVQRQAAWKTVSVPRVLAGTPAAVDGDAEISRSFEQYLRTGVANADIQRAQSEGTSSAGGYLVPEGFRALIVERMKAFGGVQAGSTVITTATGQPLPWVTNDDTGNVGAIVAENAALGSGADLAFGTKTLGAYKYASNGTGTAALKVSYELLQDSAFDVPSFVARKLGERIGRKVADGLVNGSGTGEPTGLLSTAGGLSASTAVSSNTAPTYADLLNIVHNVDPAYRAEGCVWVFNDGFLKLLRGIVDDNHRPLFWDQSMNLSNGLTGMTLLGFPVIIDQACPAPSGSNNFGFFGNLREAYVVRMVKDISMVTLNEKYAENGQVGYLAWARLDATVQDTNAGVVLRAAA